jgi:hypothetical protein
MYYRLAAGARLYRVTGPDVSRPAPLHGLGAYFTKGGRYNYAAEPTVYCAEDPTAAIAEAAFYEALEWQAKISYHRLNPVTYPLLTTHRLWCFSLEPAPAIVDLEHPQAIAQFQHTPHMLLNPGLNPARGPHVPGQPPARDYFGTQDLAKDVRGHIPPPGAVAPRPEGIRAPAIRVRRVAGYRPHQLALFVFPPEVHLPYEARSKLIVECELQLQFLQSAPRQAVTIQTVDIDWCRPRFRLRGPGAAVLPAYAPRPKARSYGLNRWYDLGIKFV